MNLLTITLNNYQKILDIINERKNENGISTIELSNFMYELKRSRTWFNTHIIKMNENEIITSLGNNKFTTKYENILDTKYFQKIILMIKDTIENIDTFYKGDFELMNLYNINRKIVQAYRAYMADILKEIKN